MTERHKQLYSFWQTVVKQNADALPEYFSPDAQIRWHNSNELFTVPEFVRANCDYPGNWEGEVEQLEIHPDGQRAMTITRVWSIEEKVTCRVVSFFAFLDDKIICLDEFWGDVEPAPQWRREMHIGTYIYKENDI